MTEYWCSSLSCRRRFNTDYPHEHHWRLLSAKGWQPDLEVRGEWLCPRCVKEA